MAGKLPYYYHAEDETFDFAKRLRKKPTAAEKFLWEVLRRKAVNGTKFRRQHPIDKYVADFYCHKFRLVVEADGEIHDEESVKAKDKVRNEAMRRYGLRVLRFKDEDVLENTKFVVEEIERHLV
jgi:very-short-patch-repair endonuclease